MMMRLLIVFFIAFSPNVLGQLVQWEKLNDAEDIRLGSVLEMHEQYILGGVVIKHYKKLNEQNRVLLHERYNVFDTLEARFVFIYDSSGTRKLSGECMSKGGNAEVMAYLKENYIYDKAGQLVQVVRLNDLNDTISLITFVLDDMNRITRANEYSTDGKLIGTDPPLLGSASNKPFAFKLIDVAVAFSDSEKSKHRWKYNEHNDLVRTSDTINKWKYDSRGNWVRVRVYNLNMGIRSLSLEQRREIVYR